MLWNELTSDELERMPKGETVILFPIGSLEVHGSHLPLGIDGLVIEKIAQLAAEKEPPSLVLPTLDYAYANENAHFPGGISLSAKTLIPLIEEICDEVSRNGFNKIILLNGHGGNNQVLRVIQRDMLRERRDYVTYMYVEPWSPIEQGIRELAKGATIDHACEIETSIALYLIGHLVKLNKVKHEAKTGVSKLPDDVKSSVSWQSYCIEGYLGDPRRATIEKGKKLADKWVSEVASLIKAVREDAASPRVLDDYYRRANLSG
jgi:creatinine amidohydrolase